MEDGGVDLAVAGDGPDIAGWPQLTTAVAVYVEPEAGLQPVLDAIRGAAATIDVENYLISDSNVMNALVAAAKGGRKVRVIMEQNPSAGSNATAFSQLSAGGVVCLYGNPVFTYTHAKSMIVDGKTLWAMTMNFSASAVSGNREYLLVDTDPEDVAEAQAVFDADWARTMPSPADLVVSPQTARAKLTALLTSAQKSLDVEWEELSDNEMGSRITQEIKAGVAVRIVVPSSVTGTATERMLQNLKVTGAQIRTLSRPYVHAKMILVDRERGFIGSENATANSLDSNRELGVVWWNADVASKVGSTFDADYGNGQPF
jgi:cardiolipin synthase A/B